MDHLAPKGSASPQAMPVFQTTHWSVVLSAGDPGSPAVHDALTRLCQAYWLPIYVFIRRLGNAPYQAEDLTQEFFRQFLEKNHVAKAVRERGRFRCFLMSSAQNFVRNVHERSQALKRGGGRTVLSLDVAQAEATYRSEPSGDVDPGRAFEQRWAATVLQAVSERLRREYVNEGRGALFEELSAHLWGEPEAVPYPKVAARSGLSLSNVKVSAHRLRQRFRQLLREEIAQTVAQPGEIDDELRHLMSVVSA